MPMEGSALSTDSRHIGRRRFLEALALISADVAWISSTLAKAPAPHARINEDVEYGSNTLPPGVRSRRVDTHNGVTLHVLEAGFESPRKPCVVLLHGFPELAYTWRHQLLPLSQAGFHVVAPDARGYGRSVSNPVTFDDAILPYSMLNFTVLQNVTLIYATVSHSRGSEPTSARLRGPDGNGCWRSTTGCVAASARDPRGLKFSRMGGCLSAAEFVLKRSLCSIRNAYAAIHKVA
jgi:hypothetical protein